MSAVAQAPIRCPEGAARCVRCDGKGLDTFTFSRQQTVCACGRCKGTGIEPKGCTYCASAPCVCDAQPDW